MVEMGLNLEQAKNKFIIQKIIRYVRRKKYSIFTRQCSKLGSRGTDPYSWFSSHMLYGYFEHCKEIFELPSDAKYLDCKEAKYTELKSSVKLKWAHHNRERDNFT